MNDLGEPDAGNPPVRFDEGRRLPAFYSTTRDLYYGIFQYYYSLSASEMQNVLYTDPAGHIYAQDTNHLIVRDQTYLMDQFWPVTMNVVGSTMTYLYAIPEPSTYAALLGLGALGFAAWRRRRRQAA